MALLNFRDVADRSPRGPLRPGRLFRAAQPYHLAESDLAVVRQAGIRTIIDLREPHEQVPPDWSPVEEFGVRVVRVGLADQILPSADERAPSRGPVLESDSVPEGHQILAAFYRAIVDQAGVGLGDIMTAIADSPGPVLVHCAAGKDRTGTSVALLLDLLGTDHERIIQDYVATEEALADVLDQLTGQTSQQRAARTGIPPGLSDAPAFAIRDLLDHVRSRGGPEKVLLRNSDRATLDRVVTFLTG